jgi:hypothetical protein
MGKRIFKSENYNSEERKMNAFYANLVPLLYLIFAIILFGFPFYFLWPVAPKSNLPFWR